MDTKLELFQWFHAPYDFLDDPHDVAKRIYIIACKYEMPRNVTFYKLVHYLIHKLDNDDVIVTMKSLNPNREINIQDIIDQMRIVSANNDPIYLVAETMASKYNGVHNTFSNASHKGYPLPDPQYGRPQLDLLRCTHYGCNQTFNHVNDLVRHLQSYGQYINGFHKQHEIAVCRYGLTPQSVIENGTRYCPSIICDKRGEFTPEELCNHLKSLGIQPFWQHGMIITNPNIQNTINLNRVYVSTECIICFDDHVRPSVLLYPCCHVNMCVNCYQNNQMSKCPICRVQIQYCLPF